MKRLKIGAYFSDPIPSDQFGEECGVWIITEVKGSWLKSRFIGEIVLEYDPVTYPEPHFKPKTGPCLESESYFRDLKQVQVTGKLLKEIEEKLILVHY